MTLPCAVLPGSPHASSSALRFWKLPRKCPDSRIFFSFLLFVCFGAPEFLKYSPFKSQFLLPFVICNKYFLFANCIQCSVGTSSTDSIVRTETHQEVKSCSCCPPVSLGLYSLVRALSLPNVPGQEGDSQDARQGPLAHTPGLPVLSREPAAH